MFTLRDTLVSALLGVQIPSADSSSDSATGPKKSKKKSHKKKAKKNSKVVDGKVVGGASKGSEDSENEDSDDDEEVVDIGHFGASEAQSHEAKAISALVYQFESTQIGTYFDFILVVCATLRCRLTSSIHVCLQRILCRS
jgi:hypothetical protein